MKPQSSAVRGAAVDRSVEGRVHAYDWVALARELENYGCAVLPDLMSAEECRTVAAFYSDESRFRSHAHNAIPAITPLSFTGVTMPGRRIPHRFCCSMSRVTSTAFTRTSTATWPSPSRSRFLFRNRGRTSPGASSY